MNELIACFLNTVAISNSGLLKKQTKKAQKSNKIYKEGFVSRARTYKNQADIVVEKNTAYAVAKQYLQYGRVAVLNFANPKNVGGGAQFAAMTQEACLCRSSNLLSCLDTENINKEFYEYYLKLQNPFYSDRLIYTQGVTVFKDEKEIPKLMPAEEWFTVDVITCAAPCLAGQGYVNLSGLMMLFKSRIKNIMEVAKAHMVDVIVLGAFGCGTFKNPPQIVAEAFCQVICEQGYFHCFKKIVFAIKPSSEDCPNCTAFLRKFNQFEPGADERCMIWDDPIEWCFCQIPKFSNASIKDNQEFKRWQWDNKYFGKQFSILGDSISTFEGYNPKGYKVFYNREKSINFGMEEARDAWWEKVIEFFGGELLVNNSWSGSKVIKLPNQENVFPSGCSDERTSSLHMETVMPDVIIVFLGINDWASGAKTGDETHILGHEAEQFDVAYGEMLKKLKANYPASEIWCCTLSETYISAHPDFKFPHAYAGTHIEEYNDIIRKVAGEYQCNLIDLYDCKMPYDTLDGSHPTCRGMDTIAVAVIEAMDKAAAEEFIECEGDKQKYLVIGDSQCDKLDDDSEDNRYSVASGLPDLETLQIAVESTRKIVCFQKKEISVGRLPRCDVVLNKNQRAVSRIHATFLYEGGSWFIRDDNSKNGVWLNGKRIQPGVKCRVTSFDEIDIACSEKLICIVQ